MKKSDLKKGMKVWCWWRSRYLWFTGVVRHGAFEFRDAGDAIIVIAEENLKNLEIR